MKTSRQGDHEPKRDAADPGEKRVVRLDPNDTSGPCAIMMDETSLVQKIATNSVGDDVTDPETAAAMAMPFAIPTGQPRVNTRLRRTASWKR